jgi:hypothetical protein
MITSFMKPSLKLSLRLLQVAVNVYDDVSNAVLAVDRNDDNVAFFLLLAVVVVVVYAVVVVVLFNESLTAGVIAAINDSYVGVCCNCSFCFSCS